MNVVWQLAVSALLVIPAVGEWLHAWRNRPPVVYDPQTRRWQARRAMERH